jgi:hypothetical protein
MLAGSSGELHSREAFAPFFADLNKYAATMHFVGQSTIFSLPDNRATGGAYTLAHHLTIDGGKAKPYDFESPVLGHVREDRRRLAICGVPALRRLD